MLPPSGEIQLELIIELKYKNACLFIVIKKIHKTDVGYMMKKLNAQLSNYESAFFSEPRFDFLKTTHYGGTAHIMQV